MSQSARRWTPAMRPRRRGYAKSPEPGCLLPESEAAEDLPVGSVAKCHSRAPDPVPAGSTRARRAARGASGSSSVSELCVTPKTLSYPMLARCEQPRQLDDVHVGQVADRAPMHAGSARSGRRPGTPPRDARFTPTCPSCRPHHLKGAKDHREAALSDGHVPQLEPVQRKDDSSAATSLGPVRWLIRDLGRFEGFSLGGAPRKQ